MTFLPVVERELRVRARLKSTYRARQVAALVSVAFGFLLLVFVAPTGVGTGSLMFGLMTGGAFLYTLFEGVRSTADCLSEEKRGGTLGLLFLTDLKGYDVVLGKLMAGSLTSSYALLSILPALAIPLILGGVTGAEFWRLSLVLLNTLFFSLTAGLFVSSMSRSERRAWLGTLGIVLFFTAVLPALKTAPGALAETVGNLSPGVAFVSSFDAVFRLRPSQFWWSLAGIHVVSWVFLLGASLLLPRVWQDGFAGASGRTGIRIAWSLRRQKQSTAERTRLRMLEANPALWLASRHQEHQGWLWTAVVFVSAIAIAVCAFTRGDVYAAMAIFYGALLVHLGLACWVASVAGHSFADARDSGALELILSTPLTPKDIVDGHVDAIRNLFFHPVLVLFLVEIGIMCSQFVLGVTSDTTREARLILSVVGGIVLALSLLDLQAAGYYGLWMGLRMKKPTKAVSRTILLVVLLPLLSLPCFVLWPIVSLIKNIILMSDAEFRLIREFRNISTGGLEPAGDQLVAAAQTVADPSALPSLNATDLSDPRR